jgi:hypothetical protein
MPFLIILAMEMEPSEKIIQKIESGDVKVRNQSGKVLNAPKKPKAEKSLIQTEGAAHEADDELAGTETTDESAKPDKAPKADKLKSSKRQKKAEKPAKEAKPEPPAFPSEAHINKYGFIGVGVAQLEAMGLQRAPKGQKGKLADSVAIEFSAYDAETKTLKIRIL